MIRILIIGDSPAPSGRGMNTASIIRLNKWMDHCGITHYSFINLENRKTIDTTGYNKVITLGGRVAAVFPNAFHAGHPSPRNRNWNSKRYEEDFLKDLKDYLDEV